MLLEAFFVFEKEKSAQKIVVKERSSFCMARKVLIKK
jgi:hypothetical protein